MLDLGFLELGVVGIVALIIFGPKRLPEIARLAGVWTSNIRRVWSGLKKEADSTIDDITEKPSQPDNTKSGRE